MSTFTLLLALLVAPSLQADQAIVGTWKFTNTSCSNGAEIEANRMKAVRAKAEAGFFWTFDQENGGEFAFHFPVPRAWYAEGEDNACIGVSSLEYGIDVGTLRLSLGKPEVKDCHEAERLTLFAQSQEGVISDYEYNYVVDGDVLTLLLKDSEKSNVQCGEDGLVVDTFERVE